MRQDPIEFGRTSLAARAAQDRIARLASRLGNRSHNATDDRVIDVIDEAFAKYPRIDSPVRRIDSGCPATPKEASSDASTPSAGTRLESIQPALVAELSAQLNALDRQREQLAQLLRSIDARSLVQ